MGDAFIARRDEGSTFNKMIEIAESYAGTINQANQRGNVSGGAYFDGVKTFFCPTASYDGLMGDLSADLLELYSDFYDADESKYNVLYIYGKNISLKTFNAGAYNNNGMWIRECKRYNKDLVGIVFSSDFDKMYFRGDTAFEHGIYYLTLIRNNSTLR